MKKNILVFDSGVGGLSILKALQTLMPEHNYAYLADNQACPYGEKTDSFLQTRIIALFTKTLETWPADAVVIACNTASTLLLAELRSHFDVDFIGVVPAIKPAATISQSKHIALLATKATTSRDYVKKLQADFAKGCHIHAFACPKLVNIAEQKLLHGTNAVTSVNNVISRFNKHTNFAQIDTLILGCTHFVFLQNEIQKAWPSAAHILDSSAAVARRCQFVLSQQCSNTTNTLQPLLLLTSTHNQGVMSECLIQFGIEQWQLLQLENEQNNMAIGAFAKK